MEKLQPIRASGSQPTALCASGTIEEPKFYQINIKNNLRNFKRKMVLLYSEPNLHAHDDARPHEYSME